MVYYKTRIFLNDVLFYGGLMSLDAVNLQIDTLGLVPDGNVDNDMKYVGNDYNMFVEATPVKIKQEV